MMPHMMPQVPLMLNLGPHSVTVSGPHCVKSKYVGLPVRPKFSVGPPNSPASQLSNSRPHAGRPVTQQGGPLGARYEDNKSESANGSSHGVKATKLTRTLASSKSQGKSIVNGDCGDGRVEV